MGKGKSLKSENKWTIIIDEEFERDTAFEMSFKNRKLLKFSLCVNKK